MTSELIDWDDQKSQVAISIAIESGAVRVKICPVHGSFICPGTADFIKTYKLAATRQKRRDFDDLFENQKELTDLIKEIIEDNSYESDCFQCKELMEKD